jgi:NADPH2:quinone reductase
MMAAAIDRFGPPSVLRLHELPVPKPGPHELLIAIDTAGVGTWDASIRDGSWRKPGRPHFPLVPGVDGAGIVAAKGARVRRFRLGDKVYAYEFGNRQGGFYAEFAAVDASHAARVPRGLDLGQAGATATIGLTALQGIDALHLRPRETVLIFGASGAVGTIAVQCAVHRGAHVIATAFGTAATRLVSQLGADRIIDARRKESVEQLRKFAPDGLLCCSLVLEAAAQACAQESAGSFGEERGQYYQHKRVPGVDAVLALAGGDELERCLNFLRPRQRSRRSL